MARSPGDSAWDSVLGADGLRTKKGETWSGLGLFRNRETAVGALDHPETALPFLSDAIESWHAVLRPVAHRGQVKFNENVEPGLILEVAKHDPGGPMIVLTSAGFDLGPDIDGDRIRDFLYNVERVRDWMGSADGLLVQQNFASVQGRDDGFTFTVWRDDAAMQNFAYRPGLHREELDRYKTERTADRSSFTRCRAVRTAGSWGGVDPVEMARQA